MSSSKWNSGGAALEDFAYCGLSLMVWEFEAGRSHATVFGVGLTLDEKKGNICVRVSKGRGGGVALPNRNKHFICSGLGEHTWVDFSGDITRFDRLEINQSLFRVDSAHVHLAGTNTTQRIIGPIPTRGRRGLRSAPVRLLGWRTGDDS